MQCARHSLQCRFYDLVENAKLSVCDHLRVVHLLGELEQPRHARPGLRVANTGLDASQRGGLNSTPVRSEQPTANCRERACLNGIAKGCPCAVRLSEGEFFGHHPCARVRRSEKTLLRLAVRRCETGAFAVLSHSASSNQWECDAGGIVAQHNGTACLRPGVTVGTAVKGVTSS
eukprot:2924847-Prymnesium_polylepis.2